MITHFFLLSVPTLKNNDLKAHKQRDKQAFRWVSVSNVYWSANTPKTTIIWFPYSLRDTRNKMHPNMHIKLRLNTNQKNKQGKWNWNKIKI